MREARGNRLHIGIYGKRNVGKSSLMNAILNQNFSIVSETFGTTTDVNQKAMELLPFGAILLMDTAGIDDTGELGKKRVDSTQKTLDRTDIAIFVYDNQGLTDCDIEFLKELESRKIPTLRIINKSDLGNSSLEDLKISLKNDKDVIIKIKKALIEQLGDEFVKTQSVVKDLVQAKDIVVLVTPIDKEAPKGRLILPQVQTIRSLLDEKCISIVCTEQELDTVLSALKEPPRLVVTDSQAFKKVDKIVPKGILLTSFSILFARLKGDLKSFIDGANKLDNLQDKDKVLICESCTHHAIEDDIGKVKIPNLIKKYSQKELCFEHYSGYDFPKELGHYALIIHCGACMTNRKEILSRMVKAQEAKVAMTNYGIAIAKCLGILERSTELFVK